MRIERDWQTTNYKNVPLMPPHSRKGRKRESNLSWKKINPSKIALITHVKDGVLNDNTSTPNEQNLRAKVKHVYWREIHRATNWLPFNNALCMWEFICPKLWMTPFTMELMPCACGRGYTCMPKPMNVRMEVNDVSFLVTNLSSYQGMNKRSTKWAGRSVLYGGGKNENPQLKDILLILVWSFSLV